MAMYRRVLLSLVNGIYDPLGIASPYTIKLKLLMKSTIAEQGTSDWDSPVPAKLTKDWISIIKEGILEDSLRFPRSTVSKKAVKKPRLVGFWDGSSQAFSGAVYVVTMISKEANYYQEELLDGDLLDNDYNEESHEFEVRLLAAKARVTPLKTGLTIPRAELSGLLVCTRLMARAAAIFPGGFSSVSCIGDSTCIISSLEKHATSFHPYMQARLAEIHNLRDKISQKSHLEEVFHVSSAENIADICTRKDSLLKNLGPDSRWQRGPDWLSSPRHQWPCIEEYCSA